MRQKRINILQRINELDKQRCKHCIDPRKANGGRCRCLAAKEVLRLGEELMTLTNPRYADALAILDNLEYQDLTVEIYNKIKETGMPDKDIYKSLKLGKTAWMNWKHSVGLIAPKKPKKKAVKS